MINFDIKYRLLSEEERIVLTNSISGTLQELNLVNFPAISTYLSSAEGRIALLRFIVNRKLENESQSIMDIVNNIENLG